MDPDFGPLPRFANGKALPPVEKSWEDCDRFRRDFEDSCTEDCDHNATETEEILSTGRKSLELLRRGP